MASSNISQTKNVIQGSSNPWEREEREKEQEIRREHARHWRDQQIAELSSFPNRTAQQDEQLKALVLERDFERRALEEEHEDDNDGQYNKNNVQEVLRLAPASNKLKQVDIKTTPTNISPSNSNDNIPVPQISPNDSQMPPPVQPKSILKHNAYSNPSSPSKHGKTTSFVDKSSNLTEITMNNTNANQLMSQMIKDMDTMNISNDFNQPISVKTQEIEFTEMGAISPPPPPERNSSFVIMQQQKIRSSGNFQNSKIAFNDQVNNNSSKFSNSPLLLSPVGGTTNPATTNLAFQQQQQLQQQNVINNNVALSSLAFGRDKRVSFHDHENNNDIEQGDLSMIREDPDVSFYQIFVNFPKILISIISAIYR